MKNTLILVIAFIIYVPATWVGAFTVFYTVVKWGDITRDISRNVRIWQMTPAQRQCAQQFTSNLAFVERQADGDSVAIGYLVGDDLTVTIYSIGAQGQCHVEFQEKVGHLIIYGSAAAHAKEDSLSLRAARKVRLSSNPSPEIYVWFDTLGIFGYDRAKHMFFAKQPDGSYKAVLSLDLCAGSSSVEIINQRDTPTIMVTNDVQCHWAERSKQGHWLESSKQSHAEYSLSDGTARRIP